MVSEQKNHSAPFSGLPTFAKFPMLTQEMLKGELDVFGIIGIPYDLGTTDFPGARLGPRAIRTASTQYAYTSSKDYHGLSSSTRGFYDVESKKWILKNKECLDIGDLEVIVGEPGKTFKLITEHINRLFTNGITPVILGGDHAISYPILQGMQKVSDITILHFDAHMDFWNPLKNSIYDHSCPFWNISKLENVKKIYQFGIRGLNHNPEMIQEAKRNKITTYTAADLRENMQKILKEVKVTKNVYISFDIDFFDPSIAPGTGTRELGGFQYNDAKLILESILRGSKTNLIGMDMVEVNPLLDVSNITSLLAARLILDILGIFDNASKNKTKNT